MQRSWSPAVAAPAAAADDDGVSSLPSDAGIPRTPTVLVFSRTTGFRHESIPAGTAGWSARTSGPTRNRSRLDESTYAGGGMGEDHPIAWCQLYEGSRAFYTGLGHTTESFEEPAFLAHLLGGIQWAAGRHRL